LEIQEENIRAQREGWGMSMPKDVGLNAIESIFYTLIPLDVQPMEFLFQNGELLTNASGFFSWWDWMRRCYSAYFFESILFLYINAQKLVLVKVCQEEERQVDVNNDAQLRSRRALKLNEMASAFRKIDIDIYDEDVLQESELYNADPRDASQALAEAKQKQAAVRTSLAR
jgi:hypothetical protein